MTYRIIRLLLRFELPGWYFGTYNQTDNQAGSSADNSVGHYPNTALFFKKKFFFSLAGEWPKLFRENNIEITRFDSGGGGGVPLFLANFPNGLLNDFRLPRRPLMVHAALLRRSCDGVAAATECADQLRRAHSARRVSTRRAE